MCQELSLLKHCIPCNAGCCKNGEFIGSPILSEDEAKKIKKKFGECVKKIISPTGKTYYIINEQKNGECFFLTDENKCRAQDMKPLDCLCYPVKAVHIGKVKFIVDAKCPAARHLSSEFIENAKNIALQSIQRFDKETYQHWLDNYIGWIDEGIELEQFLKEPANSQNDSESYSC